MLRLTDLKLPLDHDEAALPAAIVARLGIAADELVGFTVAKRSYDARKRGAIVLIYAVDVETTREADILQRLQMDEEAVDGKEDMHKVGPTPDTTYKPVARAKETTPPSRSVCSEDARVVATTVEDVRPRIRRRCGRWSSAWAPAVCSPA